MVEMYVRLILEVDWAFSRVSSKYQADVKSELNRRGYGENGSLL